MLEYYADQTDTGDITILGGPIIDADDLGFLSQAFMEFKQQQGLRASSPIKTAGWKDNDRYKAMQKHPDPAKLITACCHFIANLDEVRLLVCVVDRGERGLSQTDGDFYLIQNTAKRLQFEVQDRIHEYPEGPRSKWFVAQPPRKKMGVKAKMIVDHPGSKLEAIWSEHYSKVWKMAAHPFTHLMHLQSSLSFQHCFSSEMLQIADIVVGAVRSYLRGRPDRFDIILPRFRQSRRGKVDGWGLVFDPKPGELWEKFHADYPEL